MGTRPGVGWGPYEASIQAMGLRVEQSPEADPVGYRGTARTHAIANLSNAHLQIAFEILDRIGYK